MYILISATIILWLAVVTIIYKLNKMNSLLLDCQRDVVDLLYKTRAIDNWIDKQAELKMLTLNPDNYQSQIDAHKVLIDRNYERVRALINRENACRKRDIELLEKQIGNPTERNEDRR